MNTSRQALEVSNALTAKWGAKQPGSAEEQRQHAARVALRRYEVEQWLHYLAPKLAAFQARQRAAHQG